MGLNAMGLGFKLSATDSASTAIIGVGKSLGVLQKSAEDANRAFETTTSRTRDLTSGRFVKAPEGVLNEKTWTKVGATLTVAAAGFSAVGAGIMMGLGAASEEATKFGKSMAEISTLVPESQFAVGDMRKELFGLSSQFGGDIADQAKAMYQGISAGAADAASSAALMTQANKLAVAGVTDVRTSVDGLTNVLNAYGKEYTEGNLTGLSDAFFVAIKGGKTTAAELASSLGRLAPTASAVGVSMDQMLASVSAVTTKGLKTDEAITGLKAALTNVIKPSADAAKEAARLGIHFDAATLRAKGFPAFLDQITHSSKFTADSLPKLFESAEGLNAVLALTANGGKAFNDILANMASKSGETAKAFEKMANTTAFQQSLFNGLKQQAMILIGEALEPLKVGVYKVGNAILKAFTSAPPALQKMFTYLLVAAAGIASFTGATLGAAVAIAGMVLMGKVLLISFALILAVVLPLIAAVVALAAVGYAFKAAWDANVGGMATRVTGWFNTIRLAFDAMQQLFADGGFSGAVLKELNHGNGGVKDFAITVFLWVGRIKNFFAGIGTAFGEAVAAAGPHIQKFIGALEDIGRTFGVVQDKPDAAKAKFSAFGEAGAFVGRMLGRAFDFVVRVLGIVATVVDYALKAFSYFAPTLDTLWSAVVQVGTSFGELLAVVTGTSDAADESNGTWESLGAVIGMVAAGVAWAAATIATGISVAMAVASGTIEGLKYEFAGLWNFVKGYWNLIAGMLTGDWPQVWLGARQVVFGVVQALIGIFMGLVANIVGVVDKIGAAFGKDLGIGKAIRGASADAMKGLAGGMGLEGNVTMVGNTSKPTTPAATPYNLVPQAPSAATAPAVAQAQGAAQAGAALAAQSTAKPPPPIEVTARTTLTLDGAVLAENVTKHQQANGTKSFGPIASPP